MIRLKCNCNAQNLKVKPILSETILFFNVIVLLADTFMCNYIYKPIHFFLMSVHNHFF